MTDTSAQRPAPPAAPAQIPLQLTQEIKAAVNGALANGTPVMVAYVDEEGQPHLSFRGSTQAYSDQQLAIWARNPEGGLQGALENNPRMSLLYRDPATRTFYQFMGKAHVIGDQAVRDHVYQHAPEPERNLDPERKGLAIVIDLHRVEGFGPGGRFRMDLDGPAS